MSNVFFKKIIFIYAIWYIWDELNKIIAHEKDILIFHTQILETFDK